MNQGTNIYLTNIVSLGYYRLSQVMNSNTSNILCPPNTLTITIYVSDNNNICTPAQRSIQLSRLHSKGDVCLSGGIWVSILFLQVYDVCDVLEPQNSTDEPQGVYEMDLKVVSEALGRTILTIKLSVWAQTPSEAFLVSLSKKLFSLLSTG